MHAQPAQTRPLPRAQQDALRQAERLCWWTLLWMSLVSALMYAAMGGSQAMKTALIEDVLSLVPSIAFLVASRFRRKGADHEYLIGRERAFDINFLISAVALTGVGLALVYEAVHTLLTAARPVVGSVKLGDTVVWQGWVMMLALMISAIPPIILGRRKMALARELALKPLHTDADVGRADGDGGGLLGHRGWPPVARTVGRAVPDTDPPPAYVDRGQSPTASRPRRTISGSGVPTTSWSLPSYSNWDRK